MLTLTQREEVESVCLLSKADEAGLAKHWLWSKVEQFSALWWDQVACAAALGGRVLATDEAGYYTGPSIPSWVLTEHICSVGGRIWL